MSFAPLIKNDKSGELLLMGIGDLAANFLNRPTLTEADNKHWEAVDYRQREQAESIDRGKAGDFKADGPGDWKSSSRQKAAPKSAFAEKSLGKGDKRRQAWAP